MDILALIAFGLFVFAVPVALLELIKDRRKQRQAQAIYAALFAAVLGQVALNSDNKAMQELRVAAEGGGIAAADIATTPLRAHYPSGASSGWSQTSSYGEPDHDACVNRFAFDSYRDHFGSSSCTEDCSGHEAGFEWARDRDAGYCGGHSESFRNGCEAYVELIDECMDR